MIVLRTTLIGDREPPGWSAQCFSVRKHVSDSTLTNPVAFTRPMTTYHPSPMTSTFTPDTLLLHQPFLNIPPPHRIMRRKPNILAPRKQIKPNLARDAPWPKEAPFRLQTLVQKLLPAGSTKCLANPRPQTVPVNKPRCLSTQPVKPAAPKAMPEKPVSTSVGSSTPVPQHPEAPRRTTRPGGTARGGGVRK